MKKIPTLFVRQYENHKVIGITDELTDGLTWDLIRESIPTVKYDGSCCAVIDGVLYKRYDAKKGKKPPEGAIPCCDPDPVTGHWPHWVRCENDNPADKWFLAAFGQPTLKPEDATYEAIGKHFQGNPYHLCYDRLIKHGTIPILCTDMLQSFESIREYLSTHEMEGIVWWHDGKPLCKIKRSDFGFTWPTAGAEA